MSDDPYRVGKCKPPVAHRFKKGEPSRNPAGRKKAGPIDVVAFFDAPVTVSIDGKPKKLHPFEATLSSLVERAIVKKDIRAATLFLNYCAEAGLIVDPKAGDGGPEYYSLSHAWTFEDWTEHYERLGPPPWPGPRNGLNNKNWREEVLALES